MRAAVYRRYGPPDVVAIEEVPTPEPKRDEVLVRIHATTVAAGDWRARSLSMPKGFGPFARLIFGVSRPRQPTLGTERLLALKALAESGGFTPVIDAYFPLERIADAHARVDTGRKRGGVVVTITDAGRSRAAV